MTSVENSKFGCSRSGMKEAVHRNGYYLSKSKHINTINYMLGVRNGKIFCLKYSEVRKKPMFSPPTAPELFHELLLVASKKKLPMGMDSSTKPPEK